MEGLTVAGMGGWWRLYIGWSRKTIEIRQILKPGGGDISNRVRRLKDLGQVTWSLAASVSASANRSMVPTTSVRHYRRAKMEARRVWALS